MNLQTVPASSTAALLPVRSWALSKLLLLCFCSGKKDCDLKETGSVLFQQCLAKLQSYHLYFKCNDFFFPANGKELLPQYFSLHLFYRTEKRLWRRWLDITASAAPVKNFSRGWKIKRTFSGLFSLNQTMWRSCSRNIRYPFPCSQMTPFKSDWTWENRWNCRMNFLESFHEFQLMESCIDVSDISFVQTKLSLLWWAFNFCGCGILYKYHGIKGLFVIYLIPLEKKMRDEKILQCTCIPVEGDICA